MISDALDSAEFESPQWKSVRLGLRLANSDFSALVMAGFHLLWVLIGLVLCVVLIPFAVLGKMDAFEAALNPVALYGYVLPMAFLAAITWAVKLFSRLLWCRTPEPLTATLLAYASAAGRLLVLFAVGYIWLSGGSLKTGLLLPAVTACAGISWLGLFAEWGYLRILRRDFISTPAQALPSDEADNEVGKTTEADDITVQNRKSILTRDLGKWLKRRSPRGHAFVSWILLPLVYVTASLLADNGNLQGIPEAIFRIVVIAPAVLHIFWIPGDANDGLISALSPKTA